MMTEYISGQNRIVCDVTDRSLAVVGPGPISTCLELSIVRRLNGAGEWSARFPDTDPRTRLLDIKSRCARWYVDGMHVCTGVVEHSVTDLAGSGERTLVVSGRDLLAQLAEAPLSGLEIGKDDPSTSPVQSILVAAASWDIALLAWTTEDATGAYTLTSSPVVASFFGESALNALITVAEHIGDSFRVARDGTRRVIWLGQDAPDSGVRATGAPSDLAHPRLTHIQSLAVERDGYQMLTHVYPYGAGQGAARLNILNHTRADPAGYHTVLTGIWSEAAVAALGTKIGRHIQFKDVRPLTDGAMSLAEISAAITDAKNQLYDAGLAYLRRAESQQAVTTYRLSVTHVPDALDVGATVRVVYADDIYELDVDLVVLEIRSRWGAGGQESHELVVAPIAKRVESDASLVVSELSEARVFQAHPQTGVNAYTTGYRVYVGGDRTKGIGEIRFWFGDEVLELERALLRFTIVPVVGFTSVIGSSAEVEVEVEVSGSINIEHDHDIPVHGVDNPTSNPLARLVYFEPDNDRFVAALGSGSSGASSADDGGSTNLSLSGTGFGTVDLADALTTQYGIYRPDDTSTTFTIADLEYRLNGAGYAPLAGAVAILGGGWYALDLTSALRGANRTPINEQNVLEIRRISGADESKSAMIDAFLRVREVIQGNALS